MTTDTSATTIYDQRLTIVVGAPANSNQMTGPVTSGTNITLPQSGTYTSLELQIYLNGDRIEQVFDWNTVGAGPTRTQVQLTFQLEIGDTLDFVTQRGP